MSRCEQGARTPPAIALLLGRYHLSLASVDYRHEEWAWIVTSGSQKGMMLTARGLGFRREREGTREAAQAH